MQAAWGVPPARWACKSKAAERRSTAHAARSTAGAGRALVLQLHGDVPRQQAQLEFRAGKERVRAGFCEQPEAEAELAVAQECGPAVAVPRRPSEPYLARLWDKLYGAAAPRSALESDMLRRLRSGSRACELMKELERVC
jgi:hypothetical protein